MKVKEIIDGASDIMTVKRVFGEPIERDGLTIIPAAAVKGAGGGGEGEAPDGKGKGEGGGFGVNAHPSGAYVINHGEVSWKPAIDRNHAATVAGAVAVVALLVRRSIAKARIKAETKQHALDALAAREH